MSITITYRCDGCKRELTHPIHAFGSSFGDGATAMGVSGDWHACCDTCAQHCFEAMAERARTAVRTAAGKSLYGGGK